jgi:FtsZ-interacting cell division protein ZipA
MLFAHLHFSSNVCFYRFGTVERKDGHNAQSIVALFSCRLRKGQKMVEEKKERNDKNEISEPKAEYAEPNCADPIDKTPSESVPDLRPEDPAVEPSPSEQGQINTNDAHVPDTLVDNAANMDSTVNAEDAPSCTDSVMKTNLIDVEGETRGGDGPKAMAQAMALGVAKKKLLTHTSIFS